MSDRMRALTVIVAVFLLGCMVGAACILVWGNRVTADRGTRAGEPASRGPMRLSERLQLSPEQDTQLRQILAESRKQMEAVRRESAPRFEAIRSEMDKKIYAILNDEQKKKFEEFRKEMESRSGRPQHRRPDWGPRPPDRPEAK